MSFYLSASAGQAGLIGPGKVQDIGDYILSILFNTFSGKRSIINWSILLKSRGEWRLKETHFPLILLILTASSLIITHSPLICSDKKSHHGIFCHYIWAVFPVNSFLCLTSSRNSASGIGIFLLSILKTSLIFLSEKPFLLSLPSTFR